MTDTGTKMPIKRVLTFLDEIRSADGRDVAPPLRKAAAVAIIDNPFAGRFVEDLSPLTRASEAIGREICAIAVRLLAPDQAVSYGKAAVVGTNGEQEHGNAMLTTVFGNVMREAAGGGKAWISSMTKRARAGRGDRHSARAQGCALRALALRWHDGDAAGCAAAERDRDHCGLCHARPAEPARGRPVGGGNQGAGRAGLRATGAR